MTDALLGRDGEVAAFGAVLAGLTAGRGRLVLVEGEAGVGKTRLCESLAATARERATVAWVTCWEAGAVPAFWPWRRLLNALGEKVPPAVEDVDPHAARVVLFDAVADLLAARAATEPLVVVVDDLQWMDELSLAFLRYLVPMLRDMRLVVIATVRTGEGDAHLTRNAIRLPLQGLHAPELTELVAHVTGQTPSAQTVKRLVAQTGGNPLFVRELALAGDGDQVPTTIRAALVRRFDTTSTACRAMLEMAALLDGDPPLDVLAATLANDDVVALVDEASDAGVVTCPDGVQLRFAHPLLRRVLVDGLSVAARIRLHQRIGLVLEELAASGRPVELASLATHFAAAAAAGSAPAAVRYAAAAGDEAMRLLAYEAAVQQYERALYALDLAPAAGNRADLLLRCGDALQAVGRPGDARDRYRAAATTARDANDSARFARAALAVGSGGGFEVALFDDEQQALLQEAIELVDDATMRARLVARLSVARSLAEPPASRRAAAEEAVSLARASDDDGAVCDALAAMCDAVAGPDDAELRTQLATELVDLARRRGDTAAELLGRRLLVVAHLEQEDIAAVGDQIERYAGAARRLRRPLYDWYVPLWRATLHWMQGDAVAAVRSLDDAEAIGREAASPNADLLVITSRWCSSVDHGELDLSMLDAIPDEWLLQTWVLITKAYGCAAVGRHDDARALLDAAATGLPELHPDSEYLPTLVQAATAVIALGGHALASWLYDALLPHRHRFTVEGIGAYCHGSVERHLAGLAAVLGRDADARKHFAAAREANAKGGAGLVELTARAESVATVRPAETPGSAVFRRAGDVWEVGLAGRAGHVKDGKGMRDLGVLLTRPRQAVAAVDLVAPGPMPQEGDTGELVDAQARAAYRRRLRELEEEVDDAAAAADIGRLERATAERDTLVAHLTSAYGLGGRPRKGGDPRERARTAVTARIRDAIHRIERVDAELGEHLRRSVQTGTFCSYDPVAELRWEL